MSVPLAASLDVLREELPALLTFSAALGLEVDCSPFEADTPTLFVTFRNRVGAPATAELNCDGYPDVPPHIEFVDRATGVRGHPSLYPNCFHPTVCICAKYNRKAYAGFSSLHAEWRLKDWQDPTSGSGARLDCLAMIVSDLHAKISVTEGWLG